MPQGYLEILGEDVNSPYEVYDIDNTNDVVKMDLKRGMKVDLGSRGQFTIDSVFADSHFVYITVDKKRKI